MKFRTNTFTWTGISLCSTSLLLNKIVQESSSKDATDAWDEEDDNGTWKLAVVDTGFEEPADE